MLDGLGLDGLHRVGLVETLTQDGRADLNLHAEFGSLVGYGAGCRLNTIGRGCVAVQVGALQDGQGVAIAVDPFEQAIKLIVPAFEFGSKPVNLLHLILDRVLAAIQQLLRLHDIQSYHALAFGY